jgi:hypothetical protein
MYLFKLTEDAYNDMVRKAVKGNFASFVVAILLVGFISHPLTGIASTRLVVCSLKA